MGRGKILALDYGVKNIGLACSDELRLVVRPLPSLPHPPKRELIARLRSVAAAHDIRALVVGMPWNMDGSRGEAASRAAALAELLERELGLPVECADERLSTVEARALWASMTRRQQQRYRTVDSLAAALILERHLGGG
jgi:putative Holliday junction resolvase